MRSGTFEKSVEKLRVAEPEPSGVEPVGGGAGTGTECFGSSPVPTFLAENRLLLKQLRYLVRQIFV